MLFTRKGSNNKIPISLFGIVVLIFFSIHSFAYAESTNIQISINPSSPLFVIEKMVPGDAVSHSITVSNVGSIGFAYAVSVRKEEGSEDLFKKLMLNISNGNKTLANSNLHNISNLKLGELAVNSMQELTFSISLPIDSNDEYQNKATTVAFDFVASANSGGYNPPPRENEGEPTNRDNPPDKQDPPKQSEDQPKQPDQPSLPTPNQENPNTPESPVEPIVAPPDQAAPGIELPKTSSPWYNLLLISGIFIVLSIVLLWITLKIDRSKKWDI